MKKIIAVLLAMTMVLCLAACGDQNKSANGETDTVYTLKIAGQWSDASVHSRMFTEQFIPNVESKSNGRIKVEFYGNNSIGNEIDQLSQLQMNQLQMCILSEQSASISPTFNITILPFLFKDATHWQKAVNGPLGVAVNEGIAGSGLTCLGFELNGFRCITNNIKPITNAADMNGLKMRCATNDMYIAMYTALGCSTQAMTISEAYSALETGACDGQCNAYATIRSAALYEVQKYLSDTNHICATQYLCVNNDWFNTLPEDLQKIVTEEAAAACEWEVKTFLEESETDRQFLLDNGMTETKVDHDSFVNATQGVYDDFYAKYPELKSVVEAIKAL